MISRVQGVAIVLGVMWLCTGLLWLIDEMRDAPMCRMTLTIADNGTDAPATAHMEYPTTIVCHDPDGCVAHERAGNVHIVCGVTGVVEIVKP